MSDRAAQEHADKIREVVRRLSGTGDVPAIDFALDALLKEVERLTAERNTTERRLGMSEQTPQDEANVILAKANAIRVLVDGGFSHESAVEAITTDDLTKLKKA